MNKRDDGRAVWSADSALYGSFERDCNDPAVQARMRLAAIRDERRRVAAMQSSIAEDLPSVKQLFGTTTLAAPVGRR